MRHITAKRLVNLLLDVCVMQIEAGAHSDRVMRNVDRVAKAAGFEVEPFVTFSAVTISVIDNSDSANAATLTKVVKKHGANFKLISQMSLATWDYFDSKISFEELEQRIISLNQIPKFNVWVVRFFVGMACMCLCLLSKGDFIDGSFAFIASITGLIVRQNMAKRKFNVMFCVLAAAFVTTCIASIDVLYKVGGFPERAIATSVLYLIPGVPLINGVIDIIRGYILIGIARGTLGAYLLLAIAIGMFLSMSMFGLQYY